MMVDPKAQVYDTEFAGYVARPLSAHFAGVQARIDHEQGFAASVSNKRINGVDGLARPITFPLGTNYLNENKVSCLINRGDGWRTWGGRSTAADPIWAFLNVRRTADFINEALVDAYFNFVDRNPTKGNIELMKQSGQDFLNSLIAESYILGGRVWIDQELNTASNAAAGRWTLGVEFEPFAPMEDIRFIAHRNIQYYVDLIAEVGEAIESGALSA